MTIEIAFVLFVIWFVGFVITTIMMDKLDKQDVWSNTDRAVLAFMWVGFFIPYVLKLVGKAFMWVLLSLTNMVNKVAK